MSVESLFVKSAVEKLEEYNGRIEVCLGKLDDAQIWARGGENENAIGNLVLHLAGNVRQWIVCSLGGDAVDRDRDGEFDARGGFTAAQLTHKLRETVDAASGVIGQLTTEQLTRIYEIQVYKVSGVDAVFHVVEHFAHHAGQIIFVTKMLTRADLGFYSHLREKKWPDNCLTSCMLHWSIVFLIIALIAGVLGFTGIAGAAMGIAKILFFVFLVIWLLVFFMIRKAV